MNEKKDGIYVDFILLYKLESWQHSKTVNFKTVQIIMSLHLKEIVSPS